MMMTMRIMGWSLLAVGWLVAARGVFAVPPPPANRLHLLTVESRSVAGADVDVRAIQKLRDDWVEATTPRNAGRRVNWTQSRQPGVAEGVRGALLKKIDELRGQIQPDDIVIFYYSGHGATDQNERHLLQFDDKTILHRDELVRRLTGLGGRLTWVITDCCAVRVKLPPQEAADPSVPQQPVRPELVKLHRNLGRLFQADGVLDINSCSDGEIAWGTNSGGIFTSALVSVVRDGDVRDPNHFEQLVTAETEQDFGSFRKNQMEGRTGAILTADELDSLREQKTQKPMSWNRNRAIEAPIPVPPLVGPFPPPPPPPVEGPPRPPMIPEGKGVLITRVNPGTSATKLQLNGDAMRLEVGDRIVAINGQEIQSPEEFGEVIDGLGRGAAIQLWIIDQNSGNRMLLNGKLDIGGKFRFGVTVDAD